MTAPAVNQNAVACPKCGSATYDNRADNAKRVAEGKKPGPDFKCRNYKTTGCDGVIWAPKGAYTMVPPSGRQAPAPTKQPVSIGLTGDASLDRGVEPQGSTISARAHQLGALLETWDICFDHVMIRAVPALTSSQVGASPEAISSMVAQLFIAANK